MRVCGPWKARRRLLIAETQAPTTGPHAEDEHSKPPVAPVYTKQHTHCVHHRSVRHIAASERRHHLCGHVSGRRLACGSHGSACLCRKTTRQHGKKNKALGVFPRSGELLSPKGLSTACGRDMYVKDRWPALPMERILTRQHMSYHHPRPPKGTAVLISLIRGVLVDAHSKKRCPPPSVLSIDRHLPALNPQLAASKTADDVHCSATYRVPPWAIPKGGPQVPSTNEKQYRNPLS